MRFPRPGKPRRSATRRPRRNSGCVTPQRARGSTNLINRRRFVEGSMMPLSRQHLPVDQAGHEDAVRPRLRAAAFDARAPVTRRAAALETLFRADWERSAPRWHRNWHSLRRATSAPGLWSSTSWRPSWRLRSLCSRLGTPEATAVRQLTGADQQSRLQLNGMPIKAFVHACWCGKRPLLSPEAEATGWSSIQGKATDPAAWTIDRIVRAGPGGAKRKRWKTPAD